jgi:hypothetical protein
LRGLLAGPDNQDVSDVPALASGLGVEERALRMSIDELAPQPTVEVLAAVIRTYGIDPSWLLTGQYDAATHRTVMEGESDPAISVRQFFSERKTRISEPTRERFHFDDQS